MSDATNSQWQEVKEDTYYTKKIADTGPEFTLEIREFHAMLDGGSYRCIVNVTGYNTTLTSDLFDVHSESQLCLLLCNKYSTICCMWKLSLILI